MKSKTPVRPAQVAAQSAGLPSVNYLLRLFVAGATPRSREAVLVVRQLCAAELSDNWRLEVVDIYQQPRLARAHQIIATPTLIQEHPRPVRRFIGSLAKVSGLFGATALSAHMPL